MKSKKGFTLIELVVVMAIIAVLSLLIIAAIAAARRASVESQNRGNARTVEVAMEAYAAKNNGKYPTITAGTTFTAALTGTGTLVSYQNGWSAGTCANGGGSITSTDTTFTLTVFDSTCATTTTLATITH